MLDTAPVRPFTRRGALWVVKGPWAFVVGLTACAESMGDPSGTGGAEPGEPADTRPVETPVDGSEPGRRPRDAGAADAASLADGGVADALASPTDGRPAPADGPPDLGGGPPDSTAGPQADAAEAPLDARPPEPPDAGCPRPPAPWTRRLPRLGGVATFDELAPDWLEVYNQLGRDLDLTGWRVDADGETFAFPDDTRLASGARFVVPVGGLDGRVTLHDAAGRLIDLVWVTPGGPWPALDRAGGHTLVKQDPDTASPPGENWRPSAGPGGTPGAPDDRGPPSPAERAAATARGPADAAVIINEIMYHPVADDLAGEFVELFNRSGDAIDVGGWQLVDAVAAQLPAGTRLEPGGFLVVAADPVGLRAAHPGLVVATGFEGSLANGGERLALLDACGGLVDAVRYADGGRWPEAADGGGSSLERRDPRADGAAAEAWAASDESQRVGWQTVTYRGIAAPSSVGPDGQWEELVLGLVEAGEVLLDDLQVISDPDGAARPLLQNGDFGAGAGDARAWRFLGTHAESAVVPDPDDPANPVLRLVATGPAEHMHNHAETTLAGGARITDGQTYEVRYRARWRSGSNRLTTRLYFNRLARTTVLDRPGGGGSPGAPNRAHLAGPPAGPTFVALSHTPVVPAPGEPIRIEVTARDPDGLGRLLVFHRTVGGFAFEPMVPVGPDAPDRFVATLPGQPDGTLVHFYLGAEDARGNASTFPARGARAGALIRVESPAEPPPYHRLRVLMTPEDDARFHSDVELMSNASTPATVVYDDREVFYDVGVRAKGSERGRPMQPRLGFSIRFGSERPLRGGLETVSVDRSEGVHFGQRELLMDLVMARAGAVSAEHNDLVRIIAPRPEHTGSAVLQTHRFGDAFLDAQFEDGSDGELFEYELVYFPLTTDDGTPEGRKRPQPDGVVGTPVRDLGPDAEAWRDTFMRKNHRDRDDVEGLRALGQLFGGGAGPDLLTAAEAVLDVDQWLQAHAFANLAGGIDHYATGAQHNAHFYRRPSDGRFLYFPHDMDFFPGDPTMPVVGSADLARLLTVPAFERRYYGHLRHILDTAHTEAFLSGFCEHLGVLLPDQPFAAHCGFMFARARFMEWDAPNALSVLFPPTPFEITTNAGADFVHVGETLTVEGRAGLEAFVIRRLGEEAPAPVFWRDRITWAIDVPLEPGLNGLSFEALDARGESIAFDTLVVDRVD
ncbi:lamin tail domain-containing protein [Myxococcota bacterium]|nr:lamin tail domain-containing protein [Myxococcota bacterium]